MTRSLQRSPQSPFTHPPVLPCSFFFHCRWQWNYTFWQPGKWWLHYLRNVTMLGTSDWLLVEHTIPYLEMQGSVNTYDRGGRGRIVLARSVYVGSEIGPLQSHCHFSLHGDFFLPANCLTNHVSQASLHDRRSSSSALLPSEWGNEGSEAHWRAIILLHPPVSMFLCQPVCMQQSLIGLQMVTQLLSKCIPKIPNPSGAIHMTDLI